MSTTSPSTHSKPLDNFSRSEIAVLVISPEAVIYEGKVKAVSSINIKGQFDVLPLHVNFISIINKTLVIHELSGQNKEIKIDKGIIKVLRNTVYIFLGIETLEKETPLQELAKEVSKEPEPKP